MTPTQPNDPARVVAPTAPVPSEPTGLWRREEIFTPGGYRDATTRVLWLQTRRFYADIRVPADRPAHRGGRSFEAYSDDDLLRLAAVQGFAGVLTTTDDVCLWRRDLDYQPPGLVPDEARFEIEGDRMAELGIHAEYTEIWRREPQSRSPLAAFQRQDGVGGLLVIGGDHFLAIDGREQPPPQGSDLAAIVKRDLDGGRRDLAVARLEMGICYGRIHGAERRWEIQLSTLPWREGEVLFDSDARFDPATGLLTAELGRRWSLADADVDPDRLAKLFRPS